MSLQSHSSFDCVIFFTTAGNSDLNSADMPGAESLVGWLLEHSDLQIVESDSDSDSSIEDIEMFSDAESMSSSDFSSDEIDRLVAENQVRRHGYI